MIGEALEITIVVSMLVLVGYPSTLMVFAQGVPMNRAQNLVEDQVRSLTTDIGFIDTQKQDEVRLRGNADF